MTMRLNPILSEDTKLPRAYETGSSELSDNDDELHGFSDKKGGPPKGSAPNLYSVDVISS